MRMTTQGQGLDAQILHERTHVLDVERIAEHGHGRGHERRLQAGRARAVAGGHRY
jgi:hypothetical protein